MTSSDIEADDFLVAKKEGSNVVIPTDRDEGSSDVDVDRLEINADFAREYSIRKRREELTKHRTGEDDSSVVSDSSDSSEDEEGELLTPHLDVQILQTLQALRRGDERVYDKNTQFFENNNEEDDDPDGDDATRHKVKRFKDVAREQILEQMDGQDEAKPAMAVGTSNGLAYDQEQRDIRRAFLDSTNDSDEGEKGGSGDENDEDWIKPKAKSNTASLQEDDRARKLWEEELANSSQRNFTANSNLVDPKGEVDDGNKFLMEFMTKRRWMDPTESNLKLGRGAASDDESLDELDRTDEFESKYNFRFEEAVATGGDVEASGASHSIVHYARSSKSADNVLRRKDESRRQKRLARKERKAAERKAKEERLKRLKNAKRDELEGRMEQVRGVLGYTKQVDEKGDPSKPSMALGAAEEEMILKLMEGEYDPDKFEQVMSTAYGDDYYQAEDEKWNTDLDVKRDLANSDENERELLGDGEMYDDVPADEDTFDNEKHDDDDYEDEYDEYHKDDAGEGGEDLEASAMEQKLHTKLEDELYKLDYEDIIGDMPTRFKYRSVERNNYGLSTEEILFARDGTLKQFVSLKRMAPYREDGEYQPGTKRRKRFRQMLKADNEELDGADATEDVAKPDIEDGKKKKRRRQKKKGGSNMTDAKEPSDMKAEADETGRSEKKKRRRRKEDKPPKQPESEANVDEPMKPVGLGIKSKGDQGDVHADDKTKSKKQKDKKQRKNREGNSKKSKKTKVKGVSSARLSAYGL
mmetsp:Transcript_20300/g.47686  ORF Transcript_20300/g.47686 Transcript_20300/m.47686 type:complete len:754 (+) Transcript_20300:83-2344(+)